MRHRQVRQISHARKEPHKRLTWGTPPEPSPDIPPELTSRDYLVLLLHVAAEIEHSVMVEYLFAAYSLGTDSQRPEHKRLVQDWRNSLLAIAKEEMSHLLTVQNLLCLLGGPINLDREDYPWDAEFYPFQLSLEKVTLDSLSCFIFAEMPDIELLDKEYYASFIKDDWPGIKAAVDARTKNRNEPHHVGKIYRNIIRILQNEELIPDELFEAATLSEQASMEEWGKNHPPFISNRTKEEEVEPPRDKESRIEAHIIIPQMSSRTQAIAALVSLSRQGEAPHLSEETEGLSHLDRLIEIYHGFKQIEGWTATRNVADNPTTVDQPDTPPGTSYISSDRSREWSNLFNQRYRMLLAYLAHAYRLMRSRKNQDVTVWPGILHRVFSEMLNLKTIAGLLVCMPLTDETGDTRRAGPPFQMPYTLDLPVTEYDTWRLHVDLLEASLATSRRILDRAACSRESIDATPCDFLRSLMNLDEQSRAWIRKIAFPPAQVKRTSK